MPIQTISLTTTIDSPSHDEARDLLGTILRSHAEVHSFSFQATEEHPNLGLFRQGGLPQAGEAPPPPWQALMPRTFEESLRVAKVLSESTLIPKVYAGNPGDIMIAIQWGSEIGLRPIQSLNGIAVINGRAAIWGDAAIALVQASGLVSDLQEYFENDPGPDATPNPYPKELTAVCKIHRKGQTSPYVGRFSIADAQRAGLTTKPIWQQYPRRMLQMRARGFPLRDGFADVLRGLITAEEAQDFFHSPSPTGGAYTTNQETTNMR